MEKVTGIGGFFFKAKDPAALKQWCHDHLGVQVTPSDYDTPAWRQQGGSTVFEAFSADTSYFGRAEQQWMINFRVRDLEVMVTQLRKAGIEVAFEGNEDGWFPNGSFALLKDPEGNPIQLWQPSGSDADAEERPR